MPKGKPEKPIACAVCGVVFLRRGPTERHCSTRCRLAGYTDMTPGQGPNGDCWQWMGSTRGSGPYGQIHVDGRPRQAHQVAYETYVGRIPDGHEMRHACNNPLCVRPSHLLTGTHKQNIQDKVDAERQAKGEKHGMAKLSDTDAEWVCWLYANGRATQRRLARAFGVSPSCISYVVKRSKKRPRCIRR